MIGIGTVLGGRYELVELIGEGGMAMVYKAHCRMLDRVVAVKVLKDEYSSDLSFVQKFKTEGLAAAQLSHPNIVNIFDVGQQEDVYYIVMECIEGQTLKEVIQRDAPLPIEHAVSIAIMICDGLHHAHERGIIHRDIKPHNIIITDNGMVKVADFGIAKAISKKTITYGGNIVGSVHYISPEQARGEPVNRTSDIYSVGCVLYEMLTGRMPFDADSPITVALKHIHDDPTPPRVVNPEIPKGLENIILKAMAKLPSQRFASAQDMRSALLPYSQAGMAVAAGGEGKFFAPSNNNGVRRKKIKPITLVFVAACLIGLISGYLFMSGGLFGKEVEVPDLVGLTTKEANDKLAALNLKMKVASQEPSDEYPADRVISQKTAKGQKVKEGREIEVVISLGAEQVTIPSVVGKTIDVAELQLNSLGFKVDIQKKSDEKISENIVLSMSPGANSKVAKGSTITLIVSSGKAVGKVKMPNLLGMTLENAKKLLSDNKLVMQEIKHESSSLYFVNQVCQQSIPVGTEVDENTAVSITLSTGPGPVVQTKQLSYTLPSDQSFYQVLIRVTDNQGTRDVYNQPHRAGDKVVVAVSYYGSATVEVYTNGLLFKREKL